MSSHEVHLTENSITLGGFVSEYQTALATGAVSLAGLTAALYKMWSSTTKPYEPPVDLNNQAVIIDGKPEHRASWLAKPPDYTELERTAPECLTVFDILERGKRLSNNGPCMGKRSGPNREYEWISFQQVMDRCLQFGSGLIHKGFAPVNNTFIGMYSTNRQEWSISDLGCCAYSMCLVPLYDNLGLDACKYILNQCEAGAVVVDKTERAQAVLALLPEAPALRLLIVMDAVTVTADMEEEAQKMGVEIIQFDALLKPQPEDIYTICYTSGTTGPPKGATLTHEAILNAAEMANLHCGDHTVTAQDVHLSYLPLPHIFERVVHIFALMVGTRIGYFSGDISLLMDDLVTLKPTAFVTVPRLLNRMYDAVMADVSQSKVKSFLMKLALDSKTKDIKRQIFRRDSIWDKLIFSKIQNKLGGRVRLAFCGSSPLAGDVLHFVRCALGCPVLNGYGQTENCAIASATIIGDDSLGTVGPPAPGIHIKLVDVPELNYFVKDLSGEVCLKGKSVLRDYYKMPDKTAETIDMAGWLHTGDIGKWLPNGILCIIDRKKDIFKLSQGEYVSPDRVESAYRVSRYVGQSYVYGNSLKSCPMAVVVPDFEYCSKLDDDNIASKASADPESLCKDKEFHDLVLNDMLSHGTKAGLKGYEQVKDIILEPNMFTVENDLLTPSLKPKRVSMKAKYGELMEGLYKKHGL